MNWLQRLLGKVEPTWTNTEMQDWDARFNEFITEDFDDTSREIVLHCGW